MGLGFDVTPDDLDGAARRIGDAICALGDGRLADAIDDADYGHDGLRGALNQFVSSAHGALEVFHQDANSAGEALRASAGSYTGTETGVAGVFGGR